MPDLSIELSFNGIIAGIDEAGCGPLAGPVVAAAVILDRDKLPEADDSKKLSREAREALFDIILGTSHTGIGIATVKEIDTINILQAGKLAMRRAVRNLPMKPCVAIIDGNKARMPKLSCKIHMVIGGDALSLSIAAASIIAKVTRDRIMQELGAKHPGYGWETNVGYGTPEHHGGLAKLGITRHHRRSFAPIRALLKCREAA